MPSKIDETLTFPNLLTVYSVNGQLDKNAHDLAISTLKEIDLLDEYYNTYKYDDFIRVLQNSWILSSTYLINRIGLQKVLEYFQKFKRLLMNDDEVEYLINADDELVVYRGSKSDKEAVAKELSWTWDEGFAETFAVNRNGFVYKGTVSKENVLCVFFEEKEFVIKPDSVYNIEQVSL